jgi:hypothetical protein
MITSAVCTTCNTLTVINTAAIVGLYFHINKRLNVLEGSSTGPNKILASNKVKDPVDVRINTLENEITILLQRLQVYDELFLKMMNRMKEINPVVDRLIEDSPAAPSDFNQGSPARGLQAKKTAIRRRGGSSLMTRKEPFVDENDITTEIRRVSSTPVDPSSDFEDNDDEPFSFLKS